MLKNLNGKLELLVFCAGIIQNETMIEYAAQNNAPILPEHINCEGCRVDGIKTVFCDSLCVMR